MSAGKLGFPEWQAPLQEPVLEFGREMFAEKLQIVETAFLGRLQRLGARIDDQRERLAWNDELYVLRVIARDRRGIPDWEPGHENQPIGKRVSGPSLVRCMGW